MCGIGGIRRYGDNPILPEHIKALMISLERRGNNATGCALANGAEVCVYKDDTPAWEFTGSKKFNEFLDEFLTEETQVALIHTRAATQGDPRNNDNNHPVFRGKTALVHNGTIWDVDRMYKELKLSPKAEVDTDIMRAILDEWGFTEAGFKNLRKLRGSAAIAAVSTEYPGKLLLARTGSPIVVATCPGFVIFASEKAAIHNAMRPYKRRYGIWGQQGNVGPELYWTPMAEDSLWLLGEEHDHEGEKTVIELHESFKICNSYTAPNYDVHKTYRSRMRRYPGRTKLTERTADIFVCRNPECQKVLIIPEKWKDTPLEHLWCQNCKWMLIDPEQVKPAQTQLVLPGK